MNNQEVIHVSRVDVGTPPCGFQRWEVCFHRFADLRGSGDDNEVVSPEFSCFGHQWTLSIFYPENREVGVFLENKSDRSIVMDYSFSLRSQAGKEVAYYEETDCDFASCESDDLSWDGKPEFVLRSTILESLVEGALVIEVRMLNKNAKTNALSVQFVPENPLSINILKMLLDEESADVIFEVCGAQQMGPCSRKKAKATTTTTFHAHRLILQGGAPTLAEMCNSGQGHTTSVTINDIEPGVFRHMLQYIYGGKISEEDLESNAKKIIDAADKYGVVSLKLQAEMCYVKSTTLSITNLIDNLLYAESKNCALLKEAVMDYLVENRDEIMGKVSFDNVPGTIVTDILAAISRGHPEDNDSSDTNNYNKMRVGTLRKMLHEKGLEVDGSREAMISLLKENLEN